MERVKVVIEPSDEVVTSGPKTALGRKLRLEHPETGERLDCCDVRLSFPLEGVVKATADFYVSEIVVESHAAKSNTVDVTTKSNTVDVTTQGDLRRGYRVYMVDDERKEVLQESHNTNTGDRA
jgi:hypothetical protein